MNSSHLLLLLLLCLLVESGILFLCLCTDQLSQLLCLGGGEVVERVSGDEVIVCDCAVCGTDTSSVCTVVSSSWVLDSISRYKLLPMH